MTQEELEIIRLKLRAEVREIALQELVRAAAAQPSAMQSLQAWASRVRAQAGLQTIQGEHSATSDLLAAEYQQALREMFDGLGLG